MTTEDVYERRLINVQQLIQQWGGPTMLARKLGYTNGSAVSQWISGREISEKVARAIETKLDLPPGWLDAPHRNREKREDSSPIDDDLLARVSATVMQLAEERVEKLPHAKFSLIVSMLYKRAAETGEIDETEAKRLVQLAT